MKTECPKNVSVPGSPRRLAPEGNHLFPKLPVLLCLIALTVGCEREKPTAETAETAKSEAIVHEVHSPYSHIRLKQDGSIYSLIFVRDNGDEALQSRVDMNKKDELLVSYTRIMFTSYLLQPKPKRVLMVGLGGGAMIHFLRRFDPTLQIDVVEIDPEVVSIADKYFDVRSEGKVRVNTVDGIKFLNETAERYDVIFMDAFLKPSGETDSTGRPSALRTAAFYQRIQEILNPAGVIVFNLNGNPDIVRDIREIRESFPQVYGFRSDHLTDAVIVLATTAAERVPDPVLIERAKELDAQKRSTLWFAQMVQQLITNMP